VSDPAVAELRRYLNQVIAILQPYALSSGALNKQNAEMAIHLAAAERTLTREMLIAWHQQRASDCF
jgi:hypothetical protein